MDAQRQKKAALKVLEDCALKKSEGAQEVHKIRGFEGLRGAWNAAREHLRAGERLRAGGRSRAGEHCSRRDGLVINSCRTCAVALDRAPHAFGGGGLLQCWLLSALTRGILDGRQATSLCVLLPHLEFWIHLRQHTALMSECSVGPAVMCCALCARARCCPVLSCPCLPCRQYPGRVWHCDPGITAAGAGCGADVSHCWRSVSGRLAGGGGVRKHSPHFGLRAARK